MTVQQEPKTEVTPVNLVEDEVKSRSKYEKLIKNGEIRRVTVPLKPTSGYNHWSKWFNRVQSCHEDIRGYIGGIRYETWMDIDAEELPVDPNHEKITEAIKLLNIAFDARKNWEQERSRLVSKYFIPYDAGGHLAQKNIDYIIELFKAETGISPNITAKKPAGYEPKQVDQVSKLHKGISLLGDAWAEGKATKGTYKAVIDTSCESFWSLGHYGPDSNSCFAHKGGNSHHKYVLGQSENSFVFKIFTKATDDKTRKHKCESRAWGFFQFTPEKKLAAIHFFNPYLANKFSYGNYAKVALETVKKISGQTPITKDKAVSINREVLYMNDNRTSYIFEEKYFKPTIVPTVKFTDPKAKQVLCSKCNQETFVETDDMALKVEDKNVCESCFATASIDSYRQVRTFDPVVKIFFVSPVAGVMRGSGSINHLQDFVFSAVDGYYYHKDVETIEIIYGIDNKNEVKKGMVGKAEYRDYVSYCETTKEMLFHGVDEVSYAKCKGIELKNLVFTSLKQYEEREANSKKDNQNAKPDKSSYEEYVFNTYGYSTNVY